MTRDRVSALILLAFSIAYGVLALDIKLFPGSEYELFTARTLPLGLSIAGIVVCVLMLALPSRRADSDTELAGLNWLKVAALCGLMLLYGAAITRLGFLVSTCAFLIAGILLLGERRWTVVLGIAIPVAAGFWAILSKLLGIYLEPGLLL